VNFSVNGSSGFDDEDEDACYVLVLVVLDLANDPEMSREGLLELVEVVVLLLALVLVDDEE
jgi:hypothetical protein